MAYYLNLPEYLRARLQHLEGVKTPEEIANELGYEKAKMIEMFAAGDARVPLDKLLPLAKALGAPFLPIFCLGMQQLGMDELAEAICDRVAIAGHSLSDPEPDKKGDEDADGAGETASEPPDPELDAYGPIYVDLCFDVPSDFRRQFRLEAISRRMSYNELLMLSFQTYCAYRNPSTRKA